MPLPKLKVLRASEANWIWRALSFTVGDGGAGSVVVAGAGAGGAVALLLLAQAVSSAPRAAAAMIGSTARKEMPGRFMALLSAPCR
jgi:hypothetical protein